MSGQNKCEFTPVYLMTDAAQSIFAAIANRRPLSFSIPMRRHSFPRKGTSKKVLLKSRIISEALA
jgi:hypothetical protein